MRSCITLVAIVSAACGANDALTTEEQTLAVDGLVSVEAEGVTVDNVEEALSGDVDPTVAPDAAADASIASATAQLTPSTCVASTRVANVVTHILTGCTGPRGLAVEGTVTSTWTRDGNCLRVEHVSSGLALGGSPATLLMSVQICRNATSEGRQRHVILEAVNHRDEPIDLDGTWSVIVDRTTECQTQTGDVTVTVGDRTLARADELVRCRTSTKPVGSSSPPHLLDATKDNLDGTLELQRGSRRLQLKFLGDGTVDITNEAGKTVNSNIEMDYS